MDTPNIKIIVILGPTASGKSELAVKIAKKFNGEIISADSRQIYKGLDIGSGKITKKEMRGVPHHLLDAASPKRIFTVTQYQKLAKKALNDIVRRGKFPIICGGTGLYINSLIYDYQFPKVPPQPKLRKKLEKKSTEELFQQLKKLDPRRAKNIDKNNRRRLIRALEIVLTTKSPIPALALATTCGSKKITPYNVKYDALKIGIKKSPEELRKGIKKRVNLMLKLSLINETKQLIKKYHFGTPAFASIGYKEIIAYLQNKNSLEETIKLIEKNTRQYAKRQMTWFKRDKDIYWIKKEKEAEKLVNDFVKKM